MRRKERNLTVRLRRKIMRWKFKWMGKWRKRKKLK